VALAAVPLAGKAGAEVRGTVRDIYGRPLAGVHVLIGAGPGAIDTDENGEFGFTIAESEPSVQLTFESPLYHRERRSLALNAVPAHVSVFLIPVRLLREDVTVTALNEAEKAVAVPFAQNVVPAVAIRENQPETVVQALQNLPGVHFIGKGGVSVTPSIRGLARRRILLLVQGARITSDRSAGASAQFFPPEMIHQIEVVRSAASVIYGSDAIGGVLQVIPRDARNAQSGLASLNLSANSANQRANGGFSLAHEFDDLSVLASLQVSRAGDYSSPAGRILNSGYTYYTGSLAATYETGERRIDVSFMKSAGRDIGKPERANDPSVSSYYPEENTNLLNVSYREDALITNGSLNLFFFLNANDYELNKEKLASRQVDISKNTALDLGMRAAMKKKLDGRLALQVGADGYIRTNVDMENETWKKGSLSGSSFPVENGRRSDMGVYATLTYTGPAGIDLVGGARLGAFLRSAVSDGVFLRKSSLAPAFFLGVTRRIRDSMTLFINAGTAYRVPSLSEAFYTGITGRSSIVGNPGLEPEKSLNLDAGLKVHRKDFFLGAYLFQYSIRGMIEKFPLDDLAYTYSNIERGRIRGLELEFQLYPLRKLEIFGNAFAYHGVSTASGEHLNDVPSAKLFLGAKLWLGRFWSELDWLASAAVRHPGPAEASIPAYSVTDLKAGYYFSNRLFLFFKAANLFDQAYYANADPDIPLAKGLDLSLGLNLNL
jgi:outer membrane receptor protein involved in Fe transport